MPITKSKKLEIIKDIEEKFQKASLAAFLNFHGLKVKDVFDLRSKLKKQDCDYKVARKTLIRLALNKLGIEAEEINLEGEIAFGLTTGEAGPFLKIIFDFAKTHPEIKIIGGIFEKACIDASALNTLANLPAKEILLSRLAFTLNLPMRGLVKTLQSPIISFIYLLQNLSKIRS